VYDTPPLTPGQIAYEASAATFPPKVRKQQVPWRDIGPEPQAHWEAIGQAAQKPLRDLLDGLATEMHAEADRIAPTGFVPDYTSTIRAQVLHEYAARIRQLLGPEAS
jgi:hypothetical protein